MFELEWGNVDLEIIPVRNNPKYVQMLMWQ